MSSSIFLSLNLPRPNRQVSPNLPRKGPNPPSLFLRRSHSSPGFRFCSISMELEMESMASAIGVSIPVLRFLLCFAATIPVSFFWRIVPGSMSKHLYAALSGVFLSCISFGFSSNLHFLIPMALGYFSMLLCRRYCGVVTFFAGFGYLIGW